MEEAKIYRISLSSIIIFMTAGIIFLFLWLVNIKDIFSHIDFSYIATFIGGLLGSFVFLGYSFYLLKKRKRGMGFYWDDEGIVIDLNGNKVYWNEIENIKYYNAKGTQSTVIYPYYTNHEKIRIRRKKWMPTNSHSITWFLIESPNEFHENLMKTWEAKK